MLCEGDEGTEEEATDDIYGEGSPWETVVCEMLYESGHAVAREGSEGTGAGDQENFCHGRNAPR